MQTKPQPGEYAAQKTICKCSDQVCQFDGKCNLCAQGITWKGYERYLERVNVETLGDYALDAVSAYRTVMGVEPTEEELATLMDAVGNNYSAIDEHIQSIVRDLKEKGKL